LSNHKIVGSKWVDTVKRDGTFKLRLVCQGFSQFEGVDYFDTFSPVAKSAMVCMVFMLATVHDSELDQIDIRAAYLNAETDIPIYMKQLKGYKKGGLVCKLNKALYRTKQAGRAWAARVSWRNVVSRPVYLTHAVSVEMQDAQGYVARCTTLSTSSFCLVVWSARVSQCNAEAG
jgi:hypothetical protein